MRKLSQLAIAAFFVTSAPLALGQEAPEARPAEKPADKPGGDEMKPVPASPESKRLEESEGAWDAEIKMWTGPGDPMVSKGKQTCRMLLGGLALSCDYESTSAEMPMKGHSITMWNPTTKKYDGYWLDNYSWNGPSLSTGTWDEASRTMTESMTTDLPDGTKVAMRSVTKHESRDKHVMTFFMPGPDGKEVQSMVLTYTRAK